MCLGETKTVVGEKRKRRVDDTISAVTIHAQSGSEADRLVTETNFTKNTALSDLELEHY